VRVTIFSTFDTFGGASIAALACIRRFVGVQSRMLVQDKKGKAPEVYSVANNWVQQKIALAFAADRYQFAFYEKSKAVRFVFSQAKIGIDVTSESVVKDAEVFHLHWVNFGFYRYNLNSISQTQSPLCVDIA
jgi:hypothetical protein